MTLTMLVVISPAKKLDFESATPTKKHTQAPFLPQSENLIQALKKKKPSDISKLMKLSDSLTELNVQRYKDFKLPFTPENSKQAMFAFKGDTYVGLDADSMKASEIKYAQKHLRILSGLYGLVAPLDLIQPYRLEMGTKFPCNGHKDLYGYWKETVTAEVNKLLKKEKSLVVLASKEYFSVIDLKQVTGRVITPAFKEKKNGDYKIISFFAKKARGMMSRYIIDHQIENPEELEGFDYDGYRFNSELSGIDTPVFTRE